MLHKDRFSTLPHRGASGKEEKIKNKYFAQLFSPKMNPINLLTEIDLKESWRFFVDGSLQASDPDLQSIMNALTPSQKELSLKKLIEKDPELQDMLNEKKITKEDEEKLSFKELYKKYRAWYSFECREKGYLQGMCKMAAKALSYQGELDLKLLKLLHAIGLEGTQDTSYSEIKHKDDKRGEFRKIDKRGYSLVSEWVTKEGIKELLEEILVSPYLYLIIDDNYSKLVVGMSNLKTTTSEQKARLIERIYTCIHAHTEEGENGVKIASGFSSSAQQTVAEQIEFYQQKLIDDYHSAIKVAKNDCHKMRAILIFLKRSEHLHPFLDGNARVFFMALSMFLFAKNKLHYSLLSDMNIITGHSIKELLKKVEEGTQSLISLRKGKEVFGVTTDELLETLNEEDQRYFKTAIEPLAKFFKPSIINSDEVLKQDSQAVRKLT